MISREELFGFTLQVLELVWVVQLFGPEHPYNADSPTTLVSAWQPGAYDHSTPEGLAVVEFEGNHCSTSALKFGDHIAHAAAISVGVIMSYNINPDNFTVCSQFSSQLIKHVCKFIVVFQLGGVQQIMNGQSPVRSDPRVFLSLTSHGAFELGPPLGLLTWCRH